MQIEELEGIIELSANFRAPNPKQIPITKIRNPKRNRFGHLRFGDYLEFGICDLEFQHYLVPQQSQEPKILNCV